MKVQEERLNYSLLCLSVLRDSWLCLTRVDSVVPPGLESFPTFPALPRWANLGRPFRGWIFAGFVPPG